MLSNGSMRGSMQQGWGPQGPMGASGGPMESRSPWHARCAPGSRAVVGMQMMSCGERTEQEVTNRQNGHLMRVSFSFSHPPFTEMEMGNPAYTQQHAPPNQNAPWPNRMMAVDHYGNQSRCVIQSIPVYFYFLEVSRVHV